MFKNTTLSLLGAAALALTLQACGESSTPTSSDTKAAAAEKASAEASSATKATEEASSAKGAKDGMKDKKDAMKDKPKKPAGKANVISTGSFEGRSDHITTGRVVLVKTPKGYRLNFAPDFSLDGAPDPVVAIGNGEVYDAANKLGPLENITGRQSYALPADFTPADFTQVIVWCEKFSVPLGVANLTAK